MINIINRNDEMIIRSLYLKSDTEKGAELIDDAINSETAYVNQSLIANSFVFTYTKYNTNKI